ncbi:Hypothetical_protein [Hexamita inflata]|uniref:Hypothetical_protein n=1 Tax=Hexamita inflata TaxID=28002 RepID=A0ABP1IKN9_9EUKA
MPMFSSEESRVFKRFQLAFVCPDFVLNGAFQVNIEQDDLKLVPEGEASSDILNLNDNSVNAKLFGQLHSKYGYIEALNADIVSAEPHYRSIAIRYCERKAKSQPKSSQKDRLQEFLRLFKGQTMDNRRLFSELLAYCGEGADKMFYQMLNAGWVIHKGKQVYKIM